MPCGVIVRMGYRPDGALPLFIGGGDRLGGEGVQFKVRSEELEETMRHIFCTPSPAELVPSPYKQGESAIRMVLKPSNLITS